MKPVEEIESIVHKIETVLKEDYGAKGVNLREQTKSIENMLSPACIDNLFHIALTYKNAIQQGDNYAASQIDDIRERAKSIYEEFHVVNPKRVYSPHKKDNIVVRGFVFAGKCIYAVVNAVAIVVSFICDVIIALLIADVNN